jgi:hypothetical protein
VLDAWVEQGRVTPESSVMADGEATWRLARDVFARWSAALPRPQRTPAHLVPPAVPPAGDNPYTTPAAPFPGVWTEGRSFYRRPHRGGLILTFSILGWVICVFFGVAAWIMGNSDLKQMRAGLMDNSGYGLTQAGMIIGMIQTVLCIVVYSILFVAFIAAA